LAKRSARRVTPEGCSQFGIDTGRAQIQQLVEDHWGRYIEDRYPDPAQRRAEHIALGRQIEESNQFHERSKQASVAAKRLADTQRAKQRKLLHAIDKLRAANPHLSAAAAVRSYLQRSRTWFTLATQEQERRIQAHLRRFYRAKKLVTQRR